jgi:thiamine kinase-like enzyme
VDPEPVGGGITNQNFVVVSEGERFFVRIGDDIPEHGIMRFNEAAASRAAAAAGVSPEVVHQQDGALVLRFIEGRTFSEDDVRRPDNLERILPLVRRAHVEIPEYFRGPALVFWVFQVARDYAATLRDGNSRMISELPRLLEIAGKLEAAVGAVDLVFGHNDLLAANFIDDGERLWLVDWDYAGFNSPLFDLGGLASNNQLGSEQEDWLLEKYFEAPVSDDLRRRYAAMKCASLLRESMWSMVSEIHSSLDFDYVAYTTENLQRFERAWKEFSKSG